MSESKRLIENSRRSFTWRIALAPALLLAHSAPIARADADRVQDGARSPASAEAQTEAPPEERAAPVLAATAVLPIPDYSGSLGERRWLLGDLGGTRTDLAAKGIQFDAVWTNTLQAVVSGGRDTGAALGGTADYNLSLDLGQMGVMPGGVVKVRGESRYGNSVNGDTGSLIPVSSDLFFPLSDGLDSDVPFYLTTLSYTQFFSESFAVFAGKFDTLDGDPNEFASGRGLTQFQNFNFQFTPAPLVIVPYSTLGGGVLFKPTPDITLATSIYTTADASGTTGFNRIGDGWTWSAEAQVQYRIGRLPGGFNVGGAYAWDNDFTTLGRQFVFRPGQGIVPAPGSDNSWAMYLSTWQYLYVQDADQRPDGPLNLVDGVPDLQGLGFFARLGFADEDTNPLSFALSAGIGGRGIIPTRDNDLFGVGYFRNEIQDLRIAGIAGLRDEYEGFEAFYNLALTPSASVTFDIQVVEPTTRALDTAVVLGARFYVRF